MPNLPPERLRPMPVNSERPRQTPQADLLDALPDLAGERVLVFGPCRELAAELIDRGCRELTLLAADAMPAWREADIAIVVSIAEAEQVRPSVARALHGLAPAGRLVLRTAPELGRRVAETAVNILRLHGFSAIRTRQIGAGALVAGELPMFGRFRPA
jgi:hypothetical protein